MPAFHWSQPTGVIFPGRHHLGARRQVAAAHRGDVDPPVIRIRKRPGRHRSACSRASLRSREVASNSPGSGRAGRRSGVPLLDPEQADIPGSSLSACTGVGGEDAVEAGVDTRREVGIASLRAEAVRRLPDQVMRRPGPGPGRAPPRRSTSVTHSATTTAIAPAAQAPTTSGRRRPSKSGRKRIGSSTKVVDNHASTIVTAMMRELLRTRAACPVTNGVSTMSGQCHK